MPMALGSQGKYQEVFWEVQGRALLLTASPRERGLLLVYCLHFIGRVWSIAFLLLFFKL